MVTCHGGTTSERDPGCVKTRPLNRRELIALLGSSAAACPLFAYAQHPIKVPRIWYLGPAIAAHVAAFRRGLSDLGWVEGRTIIIDYASASTSSSPILRLSSSASTSISSRGDH